MLEANEGIGRATTQLQGGTMELEAGPCGVGWLCYCKVAADE